MKIDRDRWKVSKELLQEEYIQIPFHVSHVTYTLMKCKDELKNKTIEVMPNKTIDRNLREEFLGSQ